MSAEPDSVVVRMYRGVLGDCFLLTVNKDGDRRHCLIDCGVLQNVQDGNLLADTLPADVVAEIGEARLREVQPTKTMAKAIAEDVVKTVAAREGRIDLLVITHEHYDHVAAFTLPDVENPFLRPEVEIAELWLAWTENPADAQARDLQARFGKGRQAVALAAEAASQARDKADKMGVADSAEQELADALDEVVALAAFIGPVEGPGLPAVAGTKTTAQAIQAMREKVGAGRTRYLEPGQVLDDKQGIGLRTYVLGPPRAEARLRKDLPTEKGAKREIYLTDMDEAAAVASAARMQFRALAAASDATTSMVDDGHDPLPFARPYQAPYPAPEAQPDPTPDPEKAKLYAAIAEIRRRYEDPQEEYRSISKDWTSAAGALALKMDSDTNNTSLVLAFELPGGDVLLFPGDAQVGNWESWGDQPYPSEKFSSGEEAPIPVDDILRRVIFYKVGHHASHNATLRGRGLELMSDARLCAAIPLVEAVAKVQGPGRKTPGRGWKMPYGELHERLVAKTAGRIVQGDGRPADEIAAFEAKPAGVKPRYEKDDGGLWVELSFPLRRTP
jgi:hypothetical protein